MARRMKTCQHQKDANVDDAFAIQMQLGEGDTSDSSQRNKVCKRFIPRKLFVPEVNARMIQRNDGLAHCIVGFGFVLLVSVASHAGKREVVRNG